MLTALMILSVGLRAQFDVSPGETSILSAASGISTTCDGVTPGDCVETSPESTASVQVGMCYCGFCSNIGSCVVGLSEATVNTFSDVEHTAGMIE